MRSFCFDYGIKESVSNVSIAPDRNKMLGYAFQYSSIYAELNCLSCFTVRAKENAFLQRILNHKTVVISTCGLMICEIKV